MINIEDHIHVLGPVKANRQLTNSKEVLLREQIDIQTIDVYETLVKILRSEEAIKCS